MVKTVDRTAVYDKLVVWAAEEIRVALRAIAHGNIESAKATLKDVADALDHK